MFSKGEYVVYATNGICLIEDIGPMRNSEDTDKTYYILRPNNSQASVLYVPLDSEILCAKMRYVFTKAELEQILADVKSDCFEWRDERKNRMNAFREMLHSGDMKVLILLAGCIYRKRDALDKAGKRLSDADEHVLKSAVRIVEEEFAWVLGIPRSGVSKYIKDSLSNTK